MTRQAKDSRQAKAPRPEVRLTAEQTPDEVRAILWRIACDPEQSGTARVAARRILLLDFRERDDGTEGTARMPISTNGRSP